MKAKLEIINVEISAKPIYTCSKCGVSEKGSGYLTFNLDDLPSAIDMERYPISNHYMPSGWAGYGLYDQRCPACKS